MGDSSEQAFNMITAGTDIEEEGRGGWRERVVEIFHPTTYRLTETGAQRGREFAERREAEAEGEGKAKMGKAREGERDKERRKKRQR